jgi:hypothetical protein
MARELTDCKYEENFISKFEELSRQFIDADDEQLTSEEIELLNKNTKALNESIINAKKLRLELIKSSKLSNTAKRNFGKKFIPDSLLITYDTARLNSVQDLIDFMKLNRDLFIGTSVGVGNLSSGGSIQTPSLTGTTSILPISGTQFTIDPTESLASRLLSQQPITAPERIIREISLIEPTSFRSFDNEFESIEFRTRSGPISSAEVDSFIKENGLDAKLFVEQLQTNGRNIFSMLNSFLSKLGVGLGIMGSFCSAIEDVFSLVKALKDPSANASQFLGSFTNVLSLVNPNLSEILGEVQGMVSLLQDAQQKALNIASNLQDALSVIANAFGVVMNFIDMFEKFIEGSPETDQQQAGIEVSWDEAATKDAILNQDPAMLVIIELTGKPLGDINQDGVVDQDDADAFQNYIDGTASEEIVKYIETIFFPYLNSNAGDFAEYADFPSAQSSDSDLSSILNDFASVVGKIGAAAGSGDFGLANISQMLSIASGLSSSIQGLISSSKPVNIQNLFQQLEQVAELGNNAIENIFKDFKEVSEDYRKTVENALVEAEKNSVENPAKTAEINQGNQESLKSKFSAALTTVGESTKILGPNLLISTNKIKNGIRQLAAVGVLEKVDEQLTNVIGQMAEQTRSAISSFTPNSLSNGYHFNMVSSMAKMASTIAGAEDAVSKETTEEIKKTMKGMIAQSSEKYRQKNKEEVEFVALRFCKLAGEIERLYSEITNPLKEIVENFQQTDKQLVAAGTNTSLKAVRAGAVRFDTETRLRAMQQAGTVNASTSTDFVTGRTVAAAAATLPGIGHGPLPPIPAEFSNLPRDSDVRGNVWNGLIRYNLGGRTIRRLQASGLPLSMGWDGIFYHGGRNDRGIDMLRRFVLLARDWQQSGKRVPLTVNSAYRPGDTTPKGTPSYHGLGIALDVSVFGPDQRQFAEMARRHGFGGIGFYSSFTHIDTGPVRQW